LFVFALTVQDGLHASALVSGLAVVPMAALFLVGAVLSPKIINRFGRAAISGGAIVQVAGLAALIIVILTGWPHVAIIDFTGPFILLGAGQSIMVTGLFRVVLVDVPAYQAGIGSGVLITMQQAGLALGVAILGSIYLSLAPHSWRWPAGTWSSWSARTVLISAFLLRFLGRELFGPGARPAHPLADDGVVVDQGWRHNHVLFHRPARHRLERPRVIAAEELRPVGLGQAQDERVLVQPHEHVPPQHANGITEHELPVCVPGELGEVVETGDELGWRLAESGHGILLFGQVAGGGETAAFGPVPIVVYMRAASRAGGRRRQPCRMRTRSEQRSGPWLIAS
jgi:hypothetical protein